MKYFRLFRKSTTGKTSNTKFDATEASVGGDVTNSADTSIASKETLGSRGSKSKSKPKRKSTKSRSGASKEEKEVVHPNIKVAETFMKTVHNYDTVDDMLALFADPEKHRCKFEEGVSVTLKEWAQMVENVMASFPDGKLNHDCLKESGPSKVTIEGFRFSGTHTGVPFTFAPPFPAIEATGMYVENDEELLELRIKDGKIVGMACIAMGTLTGPPGLYEKIGGSMIPLSVEE